MKITNPRAVRWLASLGLLLAAVIWGTSFSVLKNSLDLVPYMYVLAIRFTFAAVFAILIFLPKLRGITRPEIGAGVIIGCLLFISYFFQTWGLSLTTAGKNAFLTAFYVVLVPFIHWMIKRKRPDIYVWAAMLLAIFGIGLLTLENDLGVNLGDMLTLLGGVGFAFHFIAIDHYTERYSPIRLTVVQIAVSAVLCWLFAPILHGGYSFGALTSQFWISIVYLAVICTVVAFGLQTLCQKYTAPAAASLLLSLESVFGVIFSMILLDESISLRMGIGCGLIFCGVVISETKLSFFKRKAIKSKSD